MHFARPFSITIPALALAFVTVSAMAQSEDDSHDARHVEKTTPQSPAAGKQSDAKGVAFTPIPHVEKRGDGPIAMVLIPGLSCDWTVFDSFMDRNKSRYTMYAVTLPGVDGTDAPPAPAEGEFGAWLDNADHAIWKVIEDKQIEKPVIVGHSLGGHLALRLGTEHADQLRAVVAIDGAPAFPFGLTPAETTREQRIAMAKQMMAQFKMLNDEQWNANQARMVANMVTDPKRAKEIAELCAKTPASATVQYMVDLIAADIRADLPKMTCPALVTPTAASNDPGMIDQVKSIWTDLMKGAPHAKLAFFEDTRHFVQDDRPAELDGAIADFLAGREPHGYSMPKQATTAPGSS